MRSDHRGVVLKVFNDVVPGIGVECVCLSEAMLAKAGTVLDVGGICVIGIECTSCTCIPLG